MIPLRLHLRNFLSYGESCEPLAFDGIHVACLCGPNGHGKSALLDAITWSLWGQARSTSADDLVRLGQSGMFVELEFLLDGQRYRVVRKRTRGKNSQSDLQFQVLSGNPEDGEWRPLTGQGVRGTQERITQVLRMDYETFINSAFILQGRADEFAQKPPGERKRILGEILGLSAYDELCDAARVKRRDAEMRANALTAELERLEREYARLPELQALVERLGTEHTQAQLAVETSRAELQTVLVERTLLETRRQQRDDLVRRLAGAEAHLATLRGQLEAARRKVETARALTVRAAEVRARAQEYTILCRERDEMAARVSELRELEQQRSRLQQELQRARHQLEVKLRLAQDQVRVLRARAEIVPQFEQQIMDLEQQVATLDRLQEERAGLQERLQALAAEKSAAQAEERRCSAELETVDERFQKLKTARAECPLCESELPEERRLELGRKLRHDKDALKAAQGRAIQAAGDAGRAEVEAKRRIQELDGKLRTGQTMRDRLAQAKQTHLQAAEAAKELPAELARAEELDRQLREDAVDPELKAALEAAELRMRGLDYSEPRRREIAARLGQLGSAERDLDALLRAEKELPEAESQVEALSMALETREAEIAEDRAARAEADRELTRLPAVQAEAAKREAKLQQAEGIEARLSQQLGAAREGLERCSALAEQIAERKGERAAALNEQALHEELAKAFGRNGIQALIIENALPEIETEANVLLSRMTEGQLAVRLETQRALKGGGHSETLEIKISDGMGERRYELYSGGEQFRVNFAIRIALSRLLARRAGARLETLVIDEGFGSQDREGRDRIVEAIHAVQDDFARILVITHLDELKDAFPTRIEVTKEPGGSQVAVY